MQIPFVKYQGTGNDFVLIDQRKQAYVDPSDHSMIQGICDRRFGVGADGLILLENKTGYDFAMNYFNADGKPSSMCGNGGRCIVAFAQSLDIIKDQAHFHAIDGAHDARIKDQWVELKMTDVPSIMKGSEHYELDTGSPHYVSFVQDIDDIRVVENAQAIRYSAAYKKQGINVNFVEAKAGSLIVFTYERGVEDETLSCGTGATAAALAYQLSTEANINEVAIRTKGGALKVRFRRVEDGFQDIWLCGPATRVFAGELDTEQVKAVGQAPAHYS